jgi:hypothetical protein
MASLNVSHAFSREKTSVSAKTALQASAGTFEKLEK